MKLQWTKSAVSDLQSIREFIEDDDPETANRIGLLILTSVEQLLSFPESGRLVRVRVTRALVIPVTPYFIPYRCKDKSRRLLRVLHGMRDYP